MLFLAIFLVCVAFDYAAVRWAESSHRKAAFHGAMWSSVCSLLACVVTIEIVSSPYLILATVFGHGFGSWIAIRM